MQDKFESWGFIELFGHQRIAGKISEATIGGCALIRVDVPECGDKPQYTRYFGSGAIYSISPTSEEVARLMASRGIDQPVRVWDVQQLLPDRPKSFLLDNDDDSIEDDQS